MGNHLPGNKPSSEQCAKGGEEFGSDGRHAVHGANSETAAPVAATGGWKGANTTPAAERHVTKEMARTLATEWMNHDTEAKGKLTIHEVT